LENEGGDKIKSLVYAMSHWGGAQLDRTDVLNKNKQHINRIEFFTDEKEVPLVQTLREIGGPG